MEKTFKSIIFNDEQFKLDYNDSSKFDLIVILDQSKYYYKNSRIFEDLDDLELIEELSDYEQILLIELFKLDLGLDSNFHNSINEQRKLRNKYKYKNVFSSFKKYKFEIKENTFKLTDDKDCLEPLIIDGILF